MIGAVFTLGRFGWAAFSGVDALVDASVSFAVKLALKSHHVDTQTAERMVEHMRAHVPVDSGRLLNGITYEVQDDGTVEVVASAVNPRGAGGGEGEDYALFVEKGTIHMEAEPYFYAEAEADLAKRGQDLDDAIDAAAGEDW